MKRFALTIEYDGTNYVGWQRQLNGLSVQEALENALKELLDEDVKCTASGRTDSGVHAVGQVVHFDSETKIPTDKLPFAINTCLPQDISVLKCSEVPSDFSARFWAKNKTYTYRLYASKHRHPCLDHTHTHIVGSLDSDAMKKATAEIVGKHDFKCFEAAGSVVEDTVREVYFLNINERLEGEAQIFEITVNGNGFLYNMVRIIAGTLVYVGLGKMTAEDVRQAILSKDRSLSGKTLPARGLTLLQVNYDILI